MSFRIMVYVLCRNGFKGGGGVDKGVEGEAGAEAEADDEAIEYRFAVDDAPGVGVAEKALFVFFFEGGGQEFFVFRQCLHLLLHGRVAVGRAGLWVDVAEEEVFDKSGHGDSSV